MVSKEKIAVLISGAYRTFDSTWPHNRKILDKLGVDYDVYFHTWNQNYNTNKNFNFEDNLYFSFYNILPVKYRSLNFSVADKVKNFSKEMDIKLESHEKFLDMVENKHKLHIKDVPEYYLNSLSMFYGMSEVAKLALNSKIEYKFFLRLRPDFKLPNNLKLSKNSKLKFHGVTVMISGKEISDICFSGNFIKHICTMTSFDNYIKKIREDGWFDYKTSKKRGAENWFYDVLVSNNLLLELESKYFEKKGKVIRHELVRDYDISFFNFQRKIFSRNILRLRRIYRKQMGIFISIFRNSKF